MALLEVKDLKVYFEMKKGFAQSLFGKPEVLKAVDGVSFSLDKGEILPDQIKISAIRDELDMSNNEMSVYRERLSRKGLVDKNTYGTLSFKLPRFSQIIRLWS